MRGRKPTPTHLKLVTGCPGKRPINKREPKPAGDLFAAPDWLSADQKIGWRYYIDAAPAGMLKLCDLPALATLVIAADLQRQASLKLQEGIGLLVKAGNGTPVPSPYVTIVARQSDIMLRASAELGFTPTSRGRVVMGEPPLPRDEFFD